MKKLNKILLYPMPIIAALPAMAFVTSCAENVDYGQIKAWYDEAYNNAAITFEASTKVTDSLKIGLHQLGDVEQAFINNKVRQYLPRTVINLRKEEFTEETYDVYYGSTYEERENIFLPLREQKIAEGKWIVKSTIKPNLSLIKDNLTNPDGEIGNEIKYYNLMSTLNGFVANKGIQLRDLAGWAGTLIDAAIDVRNGHPELPSLTEQALNADMDGANIGYLYLNSTNKYKSPTISMYDYYTNLASHKDRCNMFYTKTLGLDISWDETKKLDILYNRLNNFYFICFVEWKTELKWDATSAQYVKQALQIILNKIESYIKA